MKRETNELAKVRNGASRGRPREFDADEALDRAMHVFWQKGYLGTSLTDLTEAMGISRPSLYATFGNKESLFQKALDRYAAGPTAFVREALSAPTARAVAERIMLGVIDRGTCPQNPRGCLWVNGIMSCGDSTDPLHKELESSRATTETLLRKRFQRAINEGDLPGDADAAALARFVGTVNFGLSVQAAAGANRSQLLAVVKTALRAWPGSN